LAIDIAIALNFLKGLTGLSFVQNSYQIMFFFKFSNPPDFGANFWTEIGLEGASSSSENPSSASAFYQIS